MYQTCAFVLVASLESYSSTYDAARNHRANAILCVCVFWRKLLQIFQFSHHSDNVIQVYSHVWAVSMHPSPKLWAVHEMDGPLTRSDKQPGSINIPLCLILFLRGCKSVLRCRIKRVEKETMQIRPHVGPPVAQQKRDFTIASIKNAARGEILWNHCVIAGTFSCSITLCNP